MELKNALNDTNSRIKRISKMIAIASFKSPEKMKALKSQFSIILRTAGWDREDEDELYSDLLRVRKQKDFDSVMNSYRIT